MIHHDLLPLVPLFALLVWAAIEDMRSRRIRNWLTFSLILTGFIQSYIGPGSIGLWNSVLGFAAGFSLPLVLFILGAVGGGDVKLLAGVGAWLGPLPVLQVFLAEAIIGMVIVLIQATVNGRLRLLFRNSAVLTVNLLHIGDVGVDHVTQTGQSCRSVDRPLPYAVPVLLAVFLLVTGSLHLL